MITLNQYADNTVTLDVSDTSKLQFDFELHFASTSAIILHPSLCTPLVCDGKSPLRILLLTKESFYNTWQFSQAKGNQQAERLVQRYLHVRAWPKGKGPAPKQDASANMPLYKDLDAALANIKIHHLKTLHSGDRLIENSLGHLIARVDDFAIQRYNSDNFIYLFEIELNQFPALSPCKNMDLVDLSWIELESAAADAEGNPKPITDLQYYEQQDLAIARFHQERIQSKSLFAYTIKQGALDFTLDLQRPLQSHHPVFFNTRPALNVGHLTDVHISSRHHVFDRSNAQAIPAAGSINGSERIGDRVHRAFDALFNLMGQFGREHALDGIVFTGDLIDYNRNYNPACAEGEAIDTTAKLWQAMNMDNVTDNDKYPAGIDNLIFFTLVRWFYDTFQKPVFLCAGNHEAYSVPYGISPRVASVYGGFEAASVDAPDASLSLIDRITHIAGVNKGRNDELQQKMDSRNKPVNGTRANEGIPADHNLTVYEACLMFGRNYHRVLMAGYKPSQTTRNFQPENLDWFQFIFTPFTDISYHLPEQTLNLLAWGDDEVFIAPMQGTIRNPSTRDALRKKGESGIAFNPSTLPRSTRSIDDEQKKLLDAALALGKPVNVLATHFTLVNYHTTMSLLDEGDVSASRVGNGLGYFDFGTFEVNREYLYHELLHPGKMQATLSGHSHRFGVYQLQEPVKRTSHHIYKWLRKVWLPTSIPEARDGSAPQVIGDFSVRATLPDSSNGALRKSFSSHPTDKPPIVVSACGGPIAVQNYCDELAGLGMERPSGSLVRFDEKPGQATIKVLAANASRGGTDTAKPRFCVAVDFVDLLKGDIEERESGVFDAIHLYKPDENNGHYGIHLQFSGRMPQADLVASATLTLFVSDTVERFQLSRGRLPTAIANITKTHDDQYWLAIAENTSSGKSAQLFQRSLADYLEEKNDNKRKAFISLSFRDLSQVTIQDHKVFQQYDFSSPWVFPVEIEMDKQWIRTPDLASPRTGQTKMKQITLPYYPVTRHTVWGEIPQFGWYERMRTDEYGSGESEEVRQGHK